MKKLPTLESYADISRGLATHPIIENDAAIALEQKILKVKQWIREHHAFFTAVLTRKYSPAKFRDFTKNFQRIIIEEINQDKILEQRNRHLVSALLDSMTGIQDPTIRYKKNSSKQADDLLSEILTERHTITDFLESELPSLTAVAIKWELQNFSKMKQQVIDWITKNQDFLAALLNGKVGAWLQEKIYKGEKITVQLSKKIKEQIKLTLLNEDDFETLQIKKVELLNSQKNIGNSDIDKNKINQQLHSLNEQIQLELTIIKSKEKEYSINGKVKKYKQYQSMIESFLVALDQKLKNIMISKNDLANPTTASKILTEPTLLLKFLLQELPAFDNLAIVWNAEQPSKNITPLIKTEHFSSNLELPPVLTDSGPFKSQNSDQAPEAAWSKGIKI